MMRAVRPSPLPPIEALAADRIIMRSRMRHRLRGHRAVALVASALLLALCAAAAATLRVIA